MRVCCDIDVRRLSEMLWPQYSAARDATAGPIYRRRSDGMVRLPGRSSN